MIDPQQSQASGWFTRDLQQVMDLAKQISEKALEAKKAAKKGKRVDKKLLDEIDGLAFMIGDHTDMTIRKLDSLTQELVRSA